MTDFTRRGVLQASGVILASSAAVAADAPAAPLRLCYNENPFGPSERAKQAMAVAAEKSWQYPYETIGLLRQVIAGHEGLAPENVIISEGSGELLKLAALIHSADTKEVVAARPAFPMLAHYAAKRGAQVVWVDLDKDFRHDLAAMQARTGARTSLVYVCNPNNPSGTVLDAGVLRQFIAAMPQQTLVVVDEAYVDYADDPATTTVIDQVKAGRNVFITRSFSKIHGLAGARIGYGLARPDIIRAFENMRISIPNRAGLVAALASFGDKAFLAHSRTATRASLDFTRKAFDDMGVRYAPSQASFLMFDARRDGAAFVENMRKRGILLNVVQDTPSTWARVSMGRMEDMQRFITVLKSIMA